MYPSPYGLPFRWRKRIGEWARRGETTKARRRSTRGSLRYGSNEEPRALQLTLCPAPVSQARKARRKIVGKSQPRYYRWQKMDGLPARVPIDEFERFRGAPRRFDSSGIRGDSIRWRRRCREPSLAFPSSRGPIFSRRGGLRQCGARRAAPMARRDPLLDLILGRRKLDQTTLAVAQRSCCWLFHFHRAVFWPDRTRSCAVGTSRKISSKPTTVLPRNAPIRCKYRRRERHSIDKWFHEDRSELNSNRGVRV